MFLDAGFYFDVMEITPEAVGIHRFNRDNEKVGIIQLTSQTSQSTVKARNLCHYLLFFFLIWDTYFQVSFHASPWDDFKEVFSL